MAHPYYHAQSSARRFGGVWQDYIEIHRWFDQTKLHLADCRHRLILHNSFGIGLCEQQFGVTITRPSDGILVPTRAVAEQHVLEDMGGKIPPLEACLRSTKLEPWMCRGAKPLSREFQNAEALPHALPPTDGC